MSSGLLHKMNRRPVQVAQKPARSKAKEPSSVKLVKWEGVQPTGPAAPSSRFFHCSCVVGGNIVVFGGYDTRRVHNDIYILDYSSRSWKALTVTGALPSRRAKNTACLMDDRMVLLGGSNGRTEGLRTLIAANTLDITLLEWAPFRSFGDVPSPLHSHSTDYVAHNDSVVVFGGVRSSRYVSGDVHVLRWADKVWTKVECKGQAPGPRKEHGSCSSADAVFVYGGTSKSNEKFSDLYILSFRHLTPTWTLAAVAGRRPPAYVGSTLSFVQGSLLLFGGVSGGTIFVNDLHVYDPRTKTWSVADANHHVPIKLGSSMVSVTGLPAPARFGHSATYTSHGLIVMGGNKHLPLKVYYQLPV